MKLPPNYTEAQVVDICNKIVKKLCWKFKFPGHEVEDFKQEGILYALEALKRYDGKRPLENFLYVHIHNRLYNFKRNNYFRLEKPCFHCPLFAFIPPDGCSAYKDRLDCDLFAGWEQRNSIRKNLNNCLEYDQVSTTKTEKNLSYGHNPSDQLNIKDILEIIDINLPIEYRKHYLMLLSGERIPKKDRYLLEEIISTILKKNNYEL